MKNDFSLNDYELGRIEAAFRLMHSQMGMGPNDFATRCGDLQIFQKLAMQNNRWAAGVAKKVVQDAPLRQEATGEVGEDADAVGDGGGNNPS